MTPLLKIEGLTRRFGGLVAVNDFSMEIDTVQVRALIGPNGAGKTTVLNLINGVLPASSGRVFFLGQEITGQPPHAIARQGLGRTFQVGHAFPNLSVLENVMVGRHLRSRSGMVSAGLALPSALKEEADIRRKALKALEFVGLEERADDPVDTLPHGMERLLEIARALAMEPRLLLLDEPAAGLNTEETHLLQGLIRRIRDSGVAVLLVEHDMKLVMDISDQVTVMAEGKKIAEGTPDRIQRDRQVIEVYLGAEVGSGAAIRRRTRRVR